MTIRMSENQGTVTITVDLTKFVVLSHADQQCIIEAVKRLDQSAAQTLETVAEPLEREKWPEQRTGPPSNNPISRRR